MDGFEWGQSALGVNTPEELNRKDVDVYFAPNIKPKERVVNLSDKAASKYLKVALTLEFIDTRLKDPPKGAAVTQQQTEFAGEMSPYSAIIDDALVTTLSSKSSSDLLKPDGKEQLKNELINNVNHALREEEKAVNVYFTSFIIQ